jgi:hypothetical protein
VASGTKIINLQDQIIHGAITVEIILLDSLVGQKPNLMRLYVEWLVGMAGIRITDVDGLPRDGG